MLRAGSRGLAALFTGGLPPGCLCRGLAESGISSSASCTACEVLKRSLGSMGSSISSLRSSSRAPGIPETLTGARSIAKKVAKAARLT